MVKITTANPSTTSSGTSIITARIYGFEWLLSQDLASRTPNIKLHSYVTPLVRVNSDERVEGGEGK
jgi:hypothetical protein